MHAHAASGLPGYYGVYFFDAAKAQSDPVAAVQIGIRFQVGACGRDVSDTAIEYLTRVRDLCPEEDALALGDPLIPGALGLADRRILRTSHNPCLPADRRILPRYAELVSHRYLARLVQDHRRSRSSSPKKFASGRSYFHTSDLQDPDTRRTLGELYAQTMLYEDVVDRASKRIGVYREKMQIDFSKK
jgi:hypothetical protein